ncbi:hypothetical protein D3C78_837600 [compost metagenome]
MRCRQCNAQLFGRQHHDHVIAVRALFEEFGVPGEGNACVVNDTFMNRTSNQRRKFAIQTPITGASERIHHVMTIIGAKYAGRSRFAKCNGEKR